VISMPADTDVTSDRPAIRVLLVDDQELVRAGLRGILRPQFGFQIVGDCAHGAEVSAAVRAWRPHIVLMDVRMPVLDGIQATRRLTAQEDSPPVLALTTFDDDEALAGMLRAGAAGFVLKGIAAETLQEAVRTVATGGAWLDPNVTSRVLAVYRDAPGDARDQGQLQTLTDREREVLTLIGSGLTNDEIAANLIISAGTVKTHVNHIFSKLHLRHRADAVIFGFDHGLVTRHNR
jgi:DNA-binding NarL/FixJ family response regulator